MSRKYSEYLGSHIGAVGRAARYMVDNLGETDVFSGVDTEAFLRNVVKHDESKYGTEEYGPYDAYFYGTPDEDAFNRAWLHHIHNNPHHWQHWMLMNDDGKYRDPGKVVALEMPRVYALEMVADWWSFSWRSGDLTEMFRWYDENKGNIIIHQRTREYVESVLDEIRSLLSDKEGGAE